MNNKKQTKEQKFYQAGFVKGAAEMLKACGDCTLCYGKGYSSQVGLRGGHTTTTYLPCKCARGKQIRKLIETAAKLGV